jgi:trehalose/maltose hydrolase-like predicted phosphorylase
MYIEEHFVNLWHVSEDTFDSGPKALHSQETVYTIGNGYFCTRGTFEEGYPKDDGATLLFGVFDPIPVGKEELANVPDWLPIQVFINGERFRLDRGTILEYQRDLDIRQGLLQRTVRWESTQGIRIRVSSERFASLADEHTGAIRYSVTVEESGGKDCDIVIRASLNLAKGNYNLMHWDSKDQGHQNAIAWLLSETKKSGVQLAQAFSFVSNNKSFRKEMIDSDVAPGINYTGSLATGETFSAEKTIVMYTSRDSDEVLQSALDHLEKLVGASEQTLVFDELLKKNGEVWQEFWQVADIVLEGDEKAQLGIRYNIYQLRISASSHDDRYSIAAKGLTGFGYRGHVFHDTEIFMLPFFTYVLPNFARNLLLYRYNLLGTAREKAASNGYEGAQYPWESTLDGREATPTSIVHPENGDIIPVLNGFIELHITASIAHATCEYWRITGDDAFMHDYGAELLLSTALFWASRVEKNVAQDDYEISDVIGPDEWHEHANNNAFTNYMARENLQTALEALEWLQKTDPAKAEQLVTQFHLDSQRLNYWRDVIAKIRFPQNKETGLIEQFDGFFKLERFPQEKYEGRKTSYQGILGLEVIQKYQIVKQADVLMLLTVLERQFDLKTKEVNWEYYYPITDHEYGSSLSPALHTILACQLGKTDLAYKQFVIGNDVDLENLRGNTPEGIHSACAGAVWQAIAFGFAGLRVNEDGYTTRPHMPKHWTRLAFKFQHKGELVEVDLRG